MPTHGFGPAGRYRDFRMLHASSDDNVAFTRFASVGVARNRSCNVTASACRSSAMGMLPNFGTMCFVIASR